MRITPTEIRVEILRHWPKRLYHLAALVDVNPATLGGMLRGKVPMPSCVKRRVLAALKGARDGR